MKRIFTHFIRTVFLLLFFVTTVFAQNYKASVVATNGPFSALTKDTDGNIYAIKATSATQAAVVKYAKGETTEEVIYSELTRDGITYPWGLAVASNGDIYVSTSFDQSANKVLKLTKESDYEASDFLTGDNYYFTGLTIDRSNNLYALQYNDISSKYEIVRYSNLQAESKAVMYTGINSEEGLTYSTSLFADNGSLYFVEPMSNDGTDEYKGGISKITEGNKETISTQKYTTAITFDSSNNLFALEGLGSNSDYKIYKYGFNSIVGTALNVENNVGAKSSDFIYPWGIVIEGDNIFYLDGDNGEDGGKLMKLEPIILTPIVEQVTSSNDDGTYEVGDNIQIYVHFSENIRVTGTPTLELETGTVKRKAIYTGSENKIAKFDYTVQPGDVSADLDYTSVDALSLNEGTIKATNDLDAILSLPVPGEDGSLGENQSIVINTTNTTVWENDTWSNGVPDLSKKVILREAYDDNIIAQTLTFEADVTVKAGTTYTINRDVINQSNEVIFEDGAYLVQLDNEDNNFGQITFKRNSKPMYKSSILTWSSPVTSQNIFAFSPQTLPQLFGRFDESTSTWSNNVTPGDLFMFAESIAIVAPNDFNEFGQGEARVFEGIFKGRPFNGEFGSMVTKNKDGYNALGNPYPSQLDLDRLFSFNNDIASNAFVWENNNRNVNGRELIGNWNTYNKNLGWNEPLIETTSVEVGQGFVIKAESDQMPFMFNNQMRVGALQIPSKTAAADDDKFWLSLENNSNVINSTLIGYKDGATPQFDTDFDTEPFMPDYGIFSLLDDKLMSIQGRGTSLDTDDRFYLALNVPATGDYTIKISKTSGVFSEGQAIYLLDRQTNSSVNLSTQDYTFVADNGNHNSRFEILFDNESLNTSDLDLSKDVVVYNEKNTIVVKSTKEKLQTVRIYNLNGGLVENITNINSLQKTVNTNLKSQVLVVQIELVNGVKLSKKVLIKN